MSKVCPRAHFSEPPSQDSFPEHSGQARISRIFVIMFPKNQSTIVFTRRAWRAYLSEFMIFVQVERVRILSFS